MEKLFMSEELIITKINPTQKQRTSKRILERNKNKWKDKNGERRHLEDDGLDWALDIRPIFAPPRQNKNPSEGKPTETFPLTLTSAPLGEAQPDKGDGDGLIPEDNIKKELSEDEDMNPASLCVASLDKDENGEEEQYADDPRVLLPKLGQEVNPEKAANGEAASQQALENVVYPCKTCGITFSSLKYVEQHSKWCRGSRTKLGKTQASRDSTGGKRYRCSTCGYSTDVSSHLSAHLRRHTGERPYACSLCPYRAAEACTLARHRLAHSGDRRYACPICPHRAAFAGDLQKHMRRHTGERPFACLLCPYRAARPGSLKEHTATQHGEGSRTAVKCGECGFVARGVVQLRRHRCAAGGGAPAHKLFPCYLCPFNATALPLLTKHIQTSHPNLVSLYKPTPT